MTRFNLKTRRNKTPDLKVTTPDFSSMIRITFWNGLGFIFFTFIKSYVVIYFFGGSGVDLGIIMALQPLARLFSMPIIAYLTDHASKKRLILIGSMGRTLAYFLYWSSLVIRNLYFFGAGVFLQGVLVGFFWPPFFSLISEKSFKGSRTHALAKGRGQMIGYGFILGALISIPLFSIVSIFMPDNIALMYSPLLIFAIINLIAGHRFYLRVDETLTFEKFYISLDDSEAAKYKFDANEKNSKEMKQTEIIQNQVERASRTGKGFYIGLSFLIIAILTVSITGTLYTPFISAYLIENLLPGYSETVIPIIVMIVYFPAQVLSQLVSSKLGKLFDRISPSVSATVLGVFKALMIWLLILTITPYDFAVILILLHIALESNNYFIQAIMSRVSIKHRGKIFGLNMWIDQLGRVIGPLIGGILWDTLTYDAPFVISIYIGLALIPIFILGIRILSPNMVEQVDIGNRSYQTKDN